MRKAILASLVAVAMALCNQASAQQPIIIKFSHVVAPDTPKGKGALKFQELAEKYTGGKVKVEVFPNSTLYKDKEELEALQLGAVQMLAPSLAKFGPLGVKEFEVFDLPYIIPDKAALARVTKGKVAKGSKCVAKKSSKHKHHKKKGKKHTKNEDSFQLYLLALPSGPGTIKFMATATKLVGGELTRSGL